MVDASTSGATIKHAGAHTRRVVQKVSINHPIFSHVLLILGNCISAITRRISAGIAWGYKHACTYPASQKSICSEGKDCHCMHLPYAGKRGDELDYPPTGCNRVSQHLWKRCLDGTTAAAPNQHTFLHQCKACVSPFGKAKTCGVVKESTLPETDGNSASSTLFCTSAMQVCHSWQAKPCGMVRARTPPKQMGTAPPAHSVAPVQCRCVMLWQQQSYGGGGGR